MNTISGFYCFKEKTAIMMLLGVRFLVFPFVVSFSIAVVPFSGANDRGLMVGCK